MRRTLEGWEGGVSCATLMTPKLSQLIELRWGTAEMKMIPGNRRGTHIKLIFAITSMNCGEIIEMDPVRLWSWAEIRFKFTMDLNNSCFLQPSIQYKKGNGGKDYIAITIRSPGFKKQSLCDDDWSEYIKMGPPQDTKTCKYCVFPHSHPFLRIFKVNVNVTDLTPKPLSVNKWLYNDSTFMDFELKGDDGSVFLHKAILVTHSSVFRAMLKREWKETAENSMFIEGITKQTLQYLKDYMYLGTLPDDVLQLQSLLSLAAMYMIDNLIFRCIAKIVDSVTPKNFEQVFEFASRSNVPDLVKSLVIALPNETVDGIMMKAYSRSRM
ncbi:uncharacterized protein LOC133532937 [Cydia pomonella]|uniref:uncharacterized protein LOC133532937 n=1 Tax=Cydia pomonella TaxID=82600 RepID=UPI002ADD43FC|nr:uncharacterized protein LOC133532937 [Cydia pomonella]